MSHAGKILLLALTAWALGMIVPDLYRIATPLASAGFAADNDGRVYDITGPFRTAAESPAAQAGLHIGDHIDLQRMRCLPPRGSACTDLIAVVGGMGGTQLVTPNRSLTLAVRAADGAHREITVQAKRPYQSWFGRFVLLLNETTGIAFILGAVWLAWTRPGPMTLGFWLYTLWFNPGQDFVFYLLMQAHPALTIAQEVLSAAVHGAACAGFLLFALSVPDTTPDRRWRWAIPLVITIGLTVATLQLVSYATILGFQTETVSRATFVADYAVDAATVGILLRRRHGLLPHNYQRLRWVIWGCLIGLPAYILSGLLQSTSLWHTLTGRTTVPHTLIGLLLVIYGALGWFVFEAVRRPRVVTVSIPLRRITVFGLILSVPTLFAHQETEHLRVVLQLPEWAWVGFAAILLFILSRLHEWSAELADHVFNRSFRRQTLALEAVGRQILSAENAEAIDRLLAESPRDYLNLASATVFRREDQRFHRHLHGIGWPAEAADMLDERDIDSNEPSPIQPDQAERLHFPTGLATPTFAVPVRDKLACFAIALYGPHLSGADLAPDEHSMLASLANDAALAYAHVDAAHLRRRLAALEDQLMGE
jgi:hypothetical protein